MIITDIYPLVQSKSFDLKATEEARVDLVLKKTPLTPVTKLYGKVTTDDLTPIANATVKVLDKDYNPIAHTITDMDGLYVIENILKPGYYKLTAASKGFLTAKTIDFALQNKTNKCINIQLTKDTCVYKGTIYGLVTNTKNKQPIPESSIILIDKCGKTVAVTKSNTQGQYLFTRVSPGDYTVIASKVGYFDNSILILVEETLIIKCDIVLFTNTEISFGTISGIIKGDREVLKIVSVGLYKIDEEVETLTQVTFTNNEGLYLFTNVQEGQYLVKAKLESGCEYNHEFLL